MTRVLKDNKVIMAVVQSNVMIILDFIVSKMELILTSPEEVLIRENDTLESIFSMINL